MGAEKTIPPTDRLERVFDGLETWMDNHLDVDSDAYVSLNTRLENIVGRMEDKFGEDCAIHVPPKQQDNEIEQEHPRARPRQPRVSRGLQKTQQKQANCRKTRS